MKRDIRSFTRQQLAELCAELGWQSYRARQLYNWLWQKQAVEFSRMTDIARNSRELLADRFNIYQPQVLDRKTTPDGTTRYTFRLEDGSVIESVYIPDADRRTACVSTQVGCSFNCRICNTARLGLIRNLAWHEIAGQALEVSRDIRDRLTNIVFMGMGEPFANYDATVTAVTELNSDQGMNIGARRITVSTVGLPEGIRRYARFELQSRLAISLNATDDETRSRLMPINQVHPLPELITAVKEFTNLKGKRVTFEYVLVRGINDRPEDIRNLATLLAGIPCKINIIPLNPFPGCEYAAPDPAAVDQFARRLYPHLPAVTIRRSRGAAINAACGQLAAGN